MSELGDLKGCTDGGCIIKKPKGMHTNGGCRCAREIQRAGEVGRKELMKLQMQEKRIAALESAHRWVPVSERLPSKFDKVLSCNTHGVVETKMGNRMHENPDVYPYWMPIPPPPEGVK